ncbi:hypothetical protein [Constantimarinum furrinae]|uniref:Uncharacterized protein n=1 Tax=Constantimarinum furrinae TaxID=2562285 RepID=A0A7G8PRR3_9FLAO|nr:hypothetical protein [Constantimarinum furrinae]QNJ97029.1 hypothetical protein ALE3EI_0446 [Constantimarinum furrinae]
MKELINGQTIDFDLHKAGDGSATSIDGLHMHKRMNGKRFKGIDVLFPLDEKEDVVFRPSKTHNLLRRQLLNEVRRAVSKDKSKRQYLVDTIVDEISRYTGYMPQVNQVESIKRGAERIAKIFSKNTKIEEEMKQQIRSRLDFYVTKHENEDKSSFYVKQDFLRNRIKISDDLESLFKGNEKRKVDR